MQTVPNSADVWIFPADASRAERARFETYLSPDEKARASRFVNQADRHRWIAAHGQMREILARVVGDAPQSLEFEVNASGRPSLVNRTSRAIDFNLSHSSTWAMLGVSNGPKIGVDIEEIRPINRDEVVIALAESEHHYVDSLTGSTRLEAFFRFWTLKEAFVKALGTGLDLPLQSFAFSPASAGPAHLVRWDQNPHKTSQWTFSDCAPVNGYRAAIAVETAGSVTVRWHMACSASL